MNGPELLKEIMVRTLKEKAKQEEKLADTCMALMNAEGSGPKARAASDDMKKHRYAAQEFRKIAKQMETA